MRVGKGCERCRHRHIRCVIPEGASTCTPCARLDQVCHLDPRFQFKAVQHVYQKSHGTASRFDLVWDKEQVWVNVSRPVTFVLETADEGQDDGSIAENNTSFIGQASGVGTFPGNQDQDRQTADCVVGAGPSVPYPSQEHPLDEDAWSSPLRPSLDDTPTLSLREASLMRWFIQKIAPWADICDPQCHFSTVVPRRAMEVPMVLKAVLALAARHDAILANADDWEASSYHGQCLELLISALDRPEHTYDDNLLVTVVILRIYEELEHSSDERFHLLGSNRLINLMSLSASSGGMAEAVSWQFLRQAIYASIVQYQHFQLDLHNYERSSMFRRDDDAALANMAIFHCAHIIQLCRNFPQSQVEGSAWQNVADAIDKWHQLRPITWQPLRYQPADLDADRPFPEIWMMAAPAVVGMQYYHTACIFLSLTDPRSRQMNDYERTRFRRAAEKEIACHVVTVIGLSLSNESVPNAYFMACHLLHRFGYCLRHPVERQGSLEFLIRVERVLGWRTCWIRQDLERQWSELAEVDT